MAAAASIFGSVLGAIGQMKQAKAMERAEQARQKQMNLDVQRKRRDALRQSMLARATALANATSQGAEFGSGLQGGYGQIGGDLRRNNVALNQDQQLGNKVFAANRAYASAGQMVALGQGITNASDSFGKMFGSIAG